MPKPCPLGSVCAQLEQEQRSIPHPNRAQPKLSTPENNAEVSLQSSLVK